MLGFPHENQAPRPYRRLRLRTLLRHHVLRRRRRRSDVGCHVQGRPRRGHQLLRQRQRVQQGQVGGDPGSPGQGASRRSRHHDQVLQPDPRGRERARRLAPSYRAGRRGEPEASADRPHRRAVHAPLRRGDSDRGDDARARGSGARRQGDLPGGQQLVGVADPARRRHPGAQQLGAPAGHPADVQPREAPGRGGASADGRGQRHRLHPLQPGRRWIAIGQIFRPGDRPAQDQQDVRGALRRCVDVRGRGEIHRLLQGKGLASSEHGNRLGRHASGGHRADHRRAQRRAVEGFAGVRRGQDDARAARRDRRPQPNAGTCNRPVGRTEGRAGVTLLRVFAALALLALGGCAPAASTTTVASSNVEQYTGPYENGLRSGEGIYTWADGRKYVGTFRNGLPNGRGTYTLANGDTYAGEFRDNLWTQGTYSWRDGRRYAGPFRDNKPNGFGTYTWPDGKKYVGDWRDGHAEGNGTYTWPDGRKYTGAIRDDLPNGHGTMLLADGRQQTGEFRNGDFLGAQPVEIGRAHV